MRKQTWIHAQFRGNMKRTLPQPVSVNEAFESSQGGHGDEEPFGQSKKRKSTGRLSFSWRKLQSIKLVDDQGEDPADGRTTSRPNVVVARAEQRMTRWLAIRTPRLDVLTLAGLACTGAQMRWPPLLLVCRLPGRDQLTLPQSDSSNDDTTSLELSEPSVWIASPPPVSPLPSRPDLSEPQIVTSPRISEAGIATSAHRTIVASFGGAGSSHSSSGPNSEPRRICGPAVLEDCGTEGHGSAALAEAAVGREPDFCIGTAIGGTEAIGHEARCPGDGRHTR